MHKDTLEVEGDMREAYFAWLADMEGVSIKEKVEKIDIDVAVNIDDVKDLPF